MFTGVAMEHRTPEIGCANNRVAVGNIQIGASNRLIVVESDSTWEGLRWSLAALSQEIKQKDWETE